MRLTKLLKKILMMVKQIFEEVFDDCEDSVCGHHYYRQNYYCHDLDGMMPLP